MKKGSLLIAGGAINASKKEIFGTLVENAGGPNAQFALLPSATIDPHGGFKRFQDILYTLGVAKENIALLEVSPSVKGWEDGAYSEKEISKAAAADGIWILGGNQNNITKALLRSDGSDSPLLQCLREKIEGGAVIGGTSAGAAIMSDIMIGGGTSFGALAYPRAKTETDEEISDQLLITKGLNFFPEGIVDQHFDARARLGRLLEVAMVEGKAQRPAFGIAEDSAILWDAETNTIRACGSGGIYILDVSQAKRKQINQQSCIQNAVLHYIRRGDQFNIDKKSFSFNDKAQLKDEDLEFALPYPEASGVLSAYGTLVEFIASFLLDNKADKLFRDSKSAYPYIRSYLTGLRNTEQIAWEIRLHKIPENTQAWYGDGFSFTNVEIAILPASIQFQLLE